MLKDHKQIKSIQLWKFDFQEFDGATRNVVLEYPNDKTPSLPRESIEIGFALGYNRTIALGVMSVYHVTSAEPFA